jgi:hypothetical protein
MQEIWNIVEEGVSNIKNTLKGEIMCREPAKLQEQDFTTLESHILPQCVLNSRQGELELTFALLGVGHGCSDAL